VPRLLARWRDEHGITLDELNLGGGMGIRYTHEDHPVEVKRATARPCWRRSTSGERLDYPRPRLWSSRAGDRRAVDDHPLRGRHGQAAAGLTTWVAVDGGMSDNIRPALYDAEHEVALANREVSDESHCAVTVVGKHCESGDLVREHAPLPADLAVGDLLAVAATGAYTASMASNYNRCPRPAAVLVRDGEVRAAAAARDLDDLVGAPIAPGRRRRAFDRRDRDRRTPRRTS
jgi:diaminopimelate decarboxylase